LYCRVCGFKISEDENLRVDEKMSKMLNHINEMALGKVGIMWHEKDERKIREKHRVALRDCISIMDLIGREGEENEM